MIRLDLIAPLAELLRRQSADHPDKIAFEDKTRSITYRDLANEVNTLASNLIARGLPPGGSVGIWLPNSVDWVVATLAAIRAGGVAVPIAFDAKQAEMDYRVEDAGIRIIVSRIEKREAIATSGKIDPSAVILTDDADSENGFKSLCPRTASEIALKDDDIDDVSMIVYTSGTTGSPKGVMLTTRSMLWVNAACWAPIFGMGPDDTILSPLPLFHSYALNFCVLSIVANGATEYVMERFSTHEAMDLLGSGRFTKMPGVPTMFHYLMLAAKEAGTNPFSSVSRCVSAGAIMPAALNNAFEERFGVELLDGYGITETSTMVTMNWPGQARIAGSCGLPLPGLAVRIIDPATGKDVPQGDEGELVVRGPNVMKGYHNKPNETASALKNGWYHTGDLARADANSFLTITGRLKELIIRGGQNISPAEVEETIVVMDGVRDCAVVGVSHDTLGEVPVAFIVAEETAPDIDSIKAFCSERLSSYKIPHDLVIIETIPRTGSGKIIRFQLREHYENAGQGR
ncbi:class I adenylate-forming enzyme family protein [Pseudohoeflea coraliihabitans]|uniref:Acyl--CoA ligase n=1 Tax=Pseudohoeflea coraliihabitans TaxID=2860393 RepID=A0ABS6WNC3_9HYPH|nr:class I adenylate-forming enzyme family protein [Pseudohoeflea sp. DP4N28-3]MBW3097423.1 acyl--CoA ligase [Pseudohoeflea sp. DP4N28-3]